MRRLLRACLTVTTIAAVVAVLRQRREAVAVKRGELEPASAMAAIPARVEYGNVAQRLANWVPPTPVPSAAPDSPTRRAWCAPLTTFGLLVARLGGSTPKWNATHQCYVATDVSGISRLLLRRVGAHANTIGQVVLSTVPDPSPALLAHEAVHVRQYERFGPLMPVIYVMMGALYGYRDNPFERAARKGARAWVTMHSEDAAT